MLAQWLAEAVFDCECPRCQGAMSLQRRVIDDGIAPCPACGAVIDTADFREMLCLAEWEVAKQTPSVGTAAAIHRSLLH